MKETKLGVYTHNNETYNFNFITDLSVNKKRIFVRSVAEALVGDTYYDSVLRDVIFDYTTILMFTDVDLSFLRTVDEDSEIITDMELLEEFLLETNIVDIVKTNAFPTLFEELNKAVDKSIEYLTGIHMNPLNEALTSLVNIFEEKIKNVDLNSMMDMAKLFTGMTDEFTTENVVNAYLESDVHKNNLKEIADSKLEIKGE